MADENLARMFSDETLRQMAEFKKLMQDRDYTLALLRDVLGFMRNVPTDAQLDAPVRLGEQHSRTGRALWAEIETFLRVEG